MTRVDNIAQERKVGALAALQHRDYRIYWLSVLVSAVGAQMQTVVIGWHVYELTGDALQLGLTGVFRALPLLLFGLFGGTIADRMDRRRLIAATQTAGLVFAVMLALMTALNAVTVWWIYALSFLTTLAGAFESPARQAMIRGLVPRHHLTNAITLNVTLRQSANIIGPGIGGLVLAYLGGPATVYALNAVSFLAVIGAMFAIRVPPLLDVKRSNVLQSMGEGIRFIWSTPLITALLGMDLASTVLASYRVLLPIFAKDILGVGPEGFGVLAAAPAVGSVAGSVAVLARGEIYRKGAVIVGATVAYAVFLWLFGTSTSFVVSVALAGLLGMFDTLAETMKAAVLQLVTPEEMLGRVLSIGHLVFMGGPSAGYLATGFVATLLGAAGALQVGALATVAGALLVCWRVPETWQFQENG